MLGCLSWMDGVRSISRGDRIGRARKRSVLRSCFLLMWSSSCGSSFGWSRGWTRVIRFSRGVCVKGIIKSVNVRFSESDLFLCLNPKSQLNGRKNRFDLAQWVWWRGKGCLGCFTLPTGQKAGKLSLWGFSGFFCKSQYKEPLKACCYYQGNQRLLIMMSCISNWHVMRSS